MRTCIRATSCSRSISICRSSPAAPRGRRSRPRPTACAGPRSRVRPSSMRRTTSSSSTRARASTRSRPRAEIGVPSVLLVTSADRLALAANYALVKSISARRPSTSISVIANRHGEALAEQACEFLIGACSHFLNRSIEIVGAIPDDPCMQAAVGAGMSVRDAIEGSPAADAVRGMMSRLLPSPRSAIRAATFSFAPPSLPIPSRRWS